MEWPDEEQDDNNPDSLGTPEEWRARMEVPVREGGSYADNVAIQIAANVLNRDILLYPVFRYSFSEMPLFIPACRESATNPQTGVTLVSAMSQPPPGTEPICMLYYEDSRYFVIDIVCYTITVA